MRSVLHTGALTLALAAASVLPQPVEARLTRITVESTTLVDFPSFGATGPYLKIAGTFEGDLDAADPRNAVIADIGLAPQVGGKVRYTSTFFILRPADLSKGNGKLFYDFGNRGNKGILGTLNDAQSSNNPTTAEHFGNGFLMRQGYSVALSGYSGDVTPAANAMSIDLPTARNSDGTSITGMVVAESDPSQTTDTRIGPGGGGRGGIAYTTNSMSPANGTLTVREHQADPKVPVTGWTWVTPREIRFPGPAKIHWIYEFVYEAKDPTVMGIGHAATRDFLSFLRSATHDEFGNPNPVAMPGGIRAIYSTGGSNGGRAERDSLYWGFNEDEQGRRVIDGMMPRSTGAAGLMWLNFRFSQPTVSSQQHSRHHAHEMEFPHTFPVMTDPLTGQTDGLLRRCLLSNTCPKFFNIDAGQEYWMKSSSLNHTDAFGNDLDVDLLAPNVRIYSIASIDHGGASFDDRPTFVDQCQNMTNPLNATPVYRALAVALDQWVTQGILPPPSRVQMRRDGTLVPPEAVNFPTIPATHYAGWPALLPVEFHPGSMNHNVPMDFSMVPYEHIPGPEYTVLVPQVDNDGNEVAGIRLPYLEAPLGTHAGWNWYHVGRGNPDRCGQVIGSFIPLANTLAERLAAGDPRPSIAERYRNHGAYVSTVARAAARLRKQGFLLDEDVERIVDGAARHGVRLWMEQP